MAQRYNWTLVDDEAAFLDLVEAELSALADDHSALDRARPAVWCAYSRLLYRGLWRREERAAQELWLVLERMAVKAGITQLQAEELAQETIVRVLKKLATLRSPQSLLS